MRGRYSVANVGTAVFFVCWIVLFLAPHATGPDAPLDLSLFAGIALELLFFGAIFVSLGRPGTAARLRRFVRLLVIIGALVNLFMLLGVLAEIGTMSSQGALPVLLPDALFGTFDQPTLLGLGLMAITAAAGLLAVALSFRLEGLAGAMFIGCALAGLMESLYRALTGAFYPSVFWFGLYFSGLPTLGAGLLLLTLWWRARSRPSAPRPWHTV